MTKSITILALTAPALLLAGCAGSGTMNRGVESVHQPVVSHTNYTFDVNTSEGRLASGEVDRLSGWLASLRLGYGDRIAIDDPAGTGDGARKQIAAIVAEYGLFLDDHAPVTAGERAPGVVRVIITRSVATVPGCPDFSREGRSEFNANTSSNYGCAVNANLAAMVARPDDLVRGRAGAETADPAISTKAIQTLRKAPNSGATGLKAEGTSK